MWKLLGQGEIPAEREPVNTAVLVPCIYNSARDHPLEMHHPDSVGDSASARKMAHPASFPRRSASNTATASPSSLASSGTTSLSNNLMPADDYKPSALIQPLAPATSSLGTQHPPHSLSIHSQPTLLPQNLPVPAGAQIKKKSGFQITSVTPAQISVSTNNSITEDTESCDDLDESHTEDLSSSEILDVSLSRANDAGGPERSSSEETLNNFHEAETPGAVSPNQPPILPQPHGTMVNGAVHHHHHPTHPHHTHHHHHQFHSSVSGNTHPTISGSGGTQAGIPLGGVVTSTATTNAGALPIIGQKMPSNVGGILENASVGTSGVIGQPLVAGAPGTSAGMVSAAGAIISVVKPLTSNVSNVNILNSNVPGLGGISTNSSSVVFSSGLNNTNNQNVNLMQQQSGVVSSVITMTSVTTASAVIGSTNVGHVGTADMTQPSTAIPGSNTQPQQAQMPPPATTSSRFRVVKLDSSSEPFKKGRWTCTDYYDKEAPGSGSSENAPSTRTVESIRQFVHESVVGAERESISTSSVSSSVSTLSHYSESLSSGDIGGSSAVQQIFPQPPTQMPDYSTPANVSKPQMQRQDMVHPHLKASVPTTLPACTQQQQTPVNMGGLQTTTGHPSPAVAPQQLTYAQAAQLTPAQGLSGVTQQQMAYPPAQQPAAPTQVAPAHVNTLSQGGSLPPDFTQSQQIIQAAAPGSAQVLSHLSSSIPPVAVAGNGQMIPASQPPALAQSLSQGLIQPQQTPSPQIVHAPAGGVMQKPVQSTGPGVIQPPQGPQLSSQLSVEQQGQIGSQALGTKYVPAVTSSLPASNVPPNPQSDPQSNLIQNGAKDICAQPAVSALHATLPSFMATQLEDAQRLLIQHQSVLALPKLAAGECASQIGTSLGPEESGGVNALTASASLLKSLPVDGEEDSSSGASVVAIDNKIEQAMDLVKSHLMYAVREEVEVLKEQIKELIERNSQLEQENNLLKNLASPEQLAQFQAQVQSGSPPSSTQGAQQPAVAQLSAQNSGPSA
ncbi:TSC22 domain family protein 1 isoform X1 [Pygocentrus nattereri]|uniref:TSC22 domain family protein 1 isoform X1 n=1 Tax=Pygocentrus nattereri TaxID=42514 RepID=UPI0008145FBC|nr:TSC22 domain family protein 1 isoform X1 [Pygocentrus nattereri]